MKQTPETPELSKLRSALPSSLAQGEFLEWLAAQGLVLCRWMEWEDAPAGYARSTERVEDLLAKFHGIDLNRVENERRALLDHIRECREEAAHEAAMRAAYGDHGQG